MESVSRLCSSTPLRLRLVASVSSPASIPASAIVGPDERSWRSDLTVTAVWAMVPFTFWISGWMFVAIAVVATSIPAGQVERMWVSSGTETASMVLWTMPFNLSTFAFSSRRCRLLSWALPLPPPRNTRRFTVARIFALSISIWRSEKVLTLLRLFRFSPTVMSRMARDRIYLRWTPSYMLRTIWLRSRCASLIDFSLFIIRNPRTWDARISTSTPWWCLRIFMVCSSFTFSKEVSITSPSSEWSLLRGILTVWLILCASSSLSLACPTSTPSVPVLDSLLSHCADFDRASFVDSPFRTTFHLFFHHLVLLSVFLCMTLCRDSWFDYSTFFWWLRVRNEEVVRSVSFSDLDELMNSFDLAVFVIFLRSLLLLFADFFDSVRTWTRLPRFGDSNELFRKLTFSPTCPSSTFFTVIHVCFERVCSFLLSSRLPSVRSVKLLPLLFGGYWTFKIFLSLLKTSTKFI